MRHPILVAALLLVPTTSAVREAKLVRYPTYSQGRVAFTYLGDIWVADESGKNAQRLTVNTARDINPRFSPDGKWIAFSSNREGNDDVYLMPSTGGEPKQLTHHSAGDVVLGWTPDGTGIVFSSNRGEGWAGGIYTVSTTGGMPKPIGIDYGMFGSYSPDGKKFAYNRRAQTYWRKYYLGSDNSDVTLMDIATKKFVDLTDYRGEDSWPMYANGGWIYFVSDRDGNGLTNVWRVSEKGGAAEKITKFTTGDVRWPSMSTDGKTIVFEHDNAISKLDVGSGTVTPIHMEIDAETQSNKSEVREFPSQADDYDLAPSGQRIAIAIHGELFTVPVSDGDIVQITDSPARDQTPIHSPDGKWLAYVSDQSGREEIWIASITGAGAAKKLTDIDALKGAFAWSPDSRSIAFAALDGKLRIVSVDAAKPVDLVTSRYGNMSGVNWSPDGKWITYVKPDFTRVGDVYVIAATGGEEHRITAESYAESNPRFSSDGKKLFFVRNESGGGRGAAGGAGNPGSQVWAVTLDREDRDPNEVAEATQVEVLTHDTKIDWPGLRRRTRQISRLPYGVQSYTLSADGRTLAASTTEPNGTRNVPAIFTISSDGKRTTRVATLAAAGAAAEGDDTPEPAAGGGRGGGPGDLQFARDGRTLYYTQGQGIYALSVAGGGGGGATGGRGAAAAAPAAGGAGRKINFTARVKIDLRAEWKEMFGDAWRTMKYRFYDATMHGKDWNAARMKYEPLLADVGDRQELMNIINEMIGELDASHTGAALGGGRGGGGAATRHLGVDLTPDATAGRYKITKVWQDGPVDHDWVKADVGNYLIAIDGHAVKAGDEYYELLNHPLNRQVELTLNTTPSDQGAWKTRIEPITQGAFNNLRYEQWVRDRRAEVDKASDGRIGYVHIKAMDQPSLVRFQRELRDNRDKEALIIDQRWNGGGNIDQELLALLQQKQFGIDAPRNYEPTARPNTGMFGPKIVMQNWRSASDAEEFPAGFKVLGLGKTVGDPTMGACIGTGSYTLIDGGTVRTPGSGCILNDAKHTDLERWGVPPDIRVENRPEDELAGRDKQLEAAIAELQKQIGPKKRM